MKTEADRLHVQGLFLHWAVGKLSLSELIIRKVFF